MPRNRALSKLELLPTDLQTEIISRLAKCCRRHVRKLLAAVPTLASSAAVPHVFRTLNLHTLTVYPRATFNRYYNLMARCLASGNLQAHYIRDIQEYFHHDNQLGGLPHLQIAAEGNYKKAVYLYGMIMLCTVEPTIGKAMLDSLAWREKKARADRCWKRIKRSLHGVRVLQLETYMTAYYTTQATITCHPHNNGERCDDCFYYKQMEKFVFMF